jgi:hypothetical protein
VKGSDPKTRSIRAYLRQTGRPQTIRGAEFEEIQARVRGFHARGMTYATMAEQVGLSHRTVTATQFHHAMRRDTFQALLGLKYEEPTAPRSSLMPPEGTRRRLGALWAEGFPVSWQADRLPFKDNRYLYEFVEGAASKVGVQYSTFRAVADFYDSLDGETPQSMGVVPRSVAFARGFAAKRNHAPRTCWDPDTIDDPQAIPEWTGKCGSPAGYRIHYRDNIPMCEPCMVTASRDRKKRRNA